MIEFHKQFAMAVYLVLFRSPFSFYNGGIRTLRHQKFSSFSTQKTAKNIGGLVQGDEVLIIRDGIVGKIVKVASNGWCHVSVFNQKTGKTEVNSFHAIGLYGHDTYRSSGCQSQESWFERSWGDIGS